MRVGKPDTFASLNQKGSLNGAGLMPPPPLTDMAMINSTQLATELGVSKARVSQYVSEGKLAGCYTGEGRSRRFDLAKCAAALGKRLDPGQMMGNGSATKAALSKIQSDDAPRAKPLTEPRRQSGSGAEAITGTDPDRYELARIQKAEEEARKLRRQNAEAEGHYILASEAAQMTTKLIAQEIAEFETAVIRDGSRMVADKLGVDFKTVRQIMVEAWRGHRAGRAEALTAQADAAELTEIEDAENI